MTLCLSPCSFEENFTYHSATYWYAGTNFTVVCKVQPASSNNIWSLTTFTVLRMLSVGRSSWSHSCIQLTATCLRAPCILPCSLQVTCCVLHGGSALWSGSYSGRIKIQITDAKFNTIQFLIRRYLIQLNLSQASFNAQKLTTHQQMHIKFKWPQAKMYNTTDD